jgi:hypothetical protein
MRTASKDIAYIYLKIITYYIQLKSVISELLYELKNDATSNIEKINFSFSGQLFNALSPICLNQQGIFMRIF